MASVQTNPARNPNHLLINWPNAEVPLLILSFVGSRRKKEFVAVEFNSVELFVLYEDDGQDRLPLPEPPSSHLVQHKFKSPSHTHCTACCSTTSSWSRTDARFQLRDLQTPRLALHLLSQPRPQKRKAQNGRGGTVRTNETSVG